MGQAQTVALPHRWPLVQQLYTRSATVPLTKDARLVNAFAELDQTDKDYWVFKRVGVGSTPFISATPDFAGGIYFHQGSGNVISVIGTTVYINNTASGSIGPFVGPMWFETVLSGADSLVAIIGTSAAVIVDPFGGTVTTLSDVNFPRPHVPGWAFLDGTLYAMDPAGGIHGTQFTNNPFVWDPLNLIKASSKADAGVFLATQLSYVIAFKQWTTQIFYDASNPVGSPLAPVPDAQIPYGCLDANSVQKMDEVLFWISSNQSLSPQVIQMENLGVRIVSTPSVERILNSITAAPGGTPGGTALRSWVFKRAGHRFYGIVHSTLNLTLVYDIDQHLWYLWTDPNGNFWPILSMAYTAPTSTTTGFQLGQLALTGNVYVIDSSETFPNDLGALFPVDIYTPNFSGGTPRRKVLNMMYFSSDQTPGSFLQARYTDDDYKTWTNFRTIDLNFPRPYLDQEGTFTKRAYHFRHRCNTPFRIKASDLQLDLGML